MDNQSGEQNDDSDDSSSLEERAVGIRNFYLGPRHKGWNPPIHPGKPIVRAPPDDWVMQQQTSVRGLAVKLVYDFIQTLRYNLRYLRRRGDPRERFPDHPGRRRFPGVTPYTVGDMEAMFDGAYAWPLSERCDAVACAICETPLLSTDEPRVGVYLTDTLTFQPPDKAWGTYLPRDRAFHPHLMYCADCTSPQMLFPCGKATELRVVATLQPDHTMTDCTITHVSPAGHGRPWDPMWLLESLQDAPVHDMETAFGGGPESIILRFLTGVSSVDLFDLIKRDGSLDSRSLATAQAEYAWFGANLLFHLWYELPDFVAEQRLRSATQFFSEPAGTPPGKRTPAGDSIEPDR